MRTEAQRAERRRRRRVNKRRRRQSMGTRPVFESPLVRLGALLQQWTQYPPDLYWTGTYVGEYRIKVREIMTRGRVPRALLEEAMIYVERRLEALKPNHQGRCSAVWLGRWAELINHGLSTSSSTPFDTPAMFSSEETPP